MRALLFACVALVAAADAHAQGLFAGSRFTDEQATRGQAAYAKSCASCHGPALEGGQFGPPLKGDGFASHWRDKSRGVFSEKTRTTMPPGGAGSVSAQSYTDIEAYIFRANGGAPSVAESAPEQVPSRPAAQSSVYTVQGGENDPLYRVALDAKTARLAKLTPVTDTTLRQPPQADWLMWRRAYDGRGFSPLGQINRSNVSRLRMAWSWALPDSMNELTPLVHDGILFVSSGATVQALDAATGDLLWQYVRALPDEFDNGRKSRPKALAIYGDKLFVPTADGHLIALDIRSGRLVWDQAITPRPAKGLPAAAGLALNGGPIVAGGKVIVGVSLDIAVGGGCFIVGLDAESGQESWRFHTIARPGEPGGDTWNGAPLEERFGAGVWTAGSYDPELDLVYFGVGNTYNTATLLEPRPGTAGVTANDGLYTDATVALRPATGELVWHYQHHRRDVWDLDWVFEQSVVTIGGRKLVVTGGKTAMFDAVDAATGAFAFSADVGFQNVVASVDPVTGDKIVNPAVQPEAGKTKLLCPGNFGARNWPATAFSADMRVLFVPMAEWCSDYTYMPRTAAQTAAGGIDMRYTQRIQPGTTGKYGRVAALDLARRKVIWNYRQRAPIAGSALTTAGGLLFNGDLDRYFRAFDQKTGRILWTTRLGAPPESTPISYSAGSRQYVAVVSGGSSAFGAAGRGVAPELAAPPPGITLTVFSLPWPLSAGLSSEPR